MKREINVDSPNVNSGNDVVFPIINDENDIV